MLPCELHRTGKPLGLSSTKDALRNVLLRFLCRRRSKCISAGITEQCGALNLEFVDFFCDACCVLEKHAGSLCFEHLGVDRHFRIRCVFNGVAGARNQRNLFVLEARISSQIRLVEPLRTKLLKQILDVTICGEIITCRDRFSREIGLTFARFHR